MSKNNLPSVPLEIYTEIVAKSRLWRICQRFRDPEMKRLLNQKTAVIREILNTHKQDEWDRFMTTLDLHDGSIFKLNGQVFTEAKKAELFADNFQIQFSPNPGPDLPKVIASVQTIRKSPIQKALFTTPDSLAQIIKHLAKRKSPGHDTISNSALKNLPPKAIVLLTNIIIDC